LGSFSNRAGTPAGQREQPARIDKQVQLVKTMSRKNTDTRGPPRGLGRLHPISQLTTNAPIENGAEGLGRWRRQRWKGRGSGRPM
jgi:hypothetical protein